MVVVCVVDEDGVAEDEGEDRLPYLLMPLLLSLFKNCTDCLDCVNEGLVRIFEPYCENYQVRLKLTS